MLIPPLPLLNFFVAVVMMSIGLRVRGAELLDILRNRALSTRTLLANCVLIPAIGFLLIRIFPLTPDVRTGILLLAAIPGTPIALQFTRMAKTQHDLRALAGQHRHDPAGHGGDAGDGAAQSAADAASGHQHCAVHCTATVRWFVGGATSA
jgi:sodium bile acid symporter family protein